MSAFSSGRITLGAAVVVVCGLAGSIWASRSADEQANISALASIEEMRSNDDLLKQYVLAARYGMLRRYDPIVSATSALAEEGEAVHAAIDAALPVASSDVEGALGDLDARLERQLRLVERFKSEAAILKNSLAYLPVALQNFEEALAGQPGGEAVAQQARSVVQMALTYNVLNKPELGDQLRAALDDAAATAVDLPPELETDRSLLLAHARRIVDQEQSLAPTLDALLSADFQRSLLQTRAAYSQAFAALSRRAELAQLSMYGFIGMLLLLFGKVGLDLRGMYATLERRVADRTQQLAEKSSALERAGDGMRRILDNVSQGLVTIGLDGQISAERSGIVEAWLGCPRPGARLWDWLDRYDTDFAQYLELGWDDLSCGFMPPEVVLGQLPSRLVIGSRYLGFEFRLIEDGGEPSAVLVVISDITAELEREKLEQVQNETMRVFQRLSVDRSGFLEFADECDGLIALLHDDRLSPSVVKRVVHTIKGNCAIFGVESVADVCHPIESRLATDKSGLELVELAQIAGAWQAARGRIAPFIDTDELALSLTMDDYESVLGDVRARQPHAHIEKRLSDWRLEPTARRLMRVGEQASRIAERLGRPIELEIEDSGLRLPPKPWGGFWSAFIHVIRNAVDHGLEPAEERVAAGKAPAGVLRLSTRCRDEHFIVSVRDDGRGIDWDRIRAKAAAAGLPHQTRDELIAALFEDGISARDEATALSGRGVGTGAVRDACHELGGDVEVVSAPGEGTEFRFVFPRAVMLAKAEDAQAA